jgi:hypothetical protein
VYRYTHLVHWGRDAYERGVFDEEERGDGFFEERWVDASGFF